jgi:general secretion pathway protein K
MPGCLKLLKDKKGGVALILVIWIMVMLMAIVGEFTYSMRTELNITKNFKEEEEAYQLALAGIEHAKIEILSAEGPTYLNENGILVFGQADEEPLRSGKLGRGSFTYTIIDEDGKLNINIASQAQLKYIFQNSGVDIEEVDTIVDSIIDWRDRNNLHMLNGAEEEYYQSLPEPYSCKDRPFDIIEELLLVKGMTPEIFYGSDSEGEKKYDGVVKYLTVRGSRIVNINTAPRIVLEALFGIEMADNIIRQRETAPITKPTAHGKVTSVFFTIISTGTNADGTIKRTIKTIVQKKERKVETVYWNDNFLG